MSEYIQNDVKSQESASILQISNYCQNRVLIIDLLEIKEDKIFLIYLGQILIIKFSLVKLSIKLILNNFFMKCKIYLNMLK